MPNLWFKLYGDSKPFEESLARAQRAASDIGGQIGKKFEFKDIGRTLATSLGFSLEKIADKAARVFTGMSEEVENANRTIEEATTRHADYVITKMRETMDLEKQYQLLLKDRDKILKNAPAKAEQPGLLGQSLDVGLFLASAMKVPLVSTFAKDSLRNRISARNEPVQAARALAQNAADEKETQAAAIKAKIEEKRTKLAEMRRTYQIDELSTMGQFNTISDELEELEKSRAALAAKSADTTDKELAIEQKKLELKRIWRELERQAAEDIKKNVDLEEKRKRLTQETLTAEKGVAEARANLSEAQNERGQLSLGELSNFSQFSFGADQSVRDESEKARAAQELVRKANEARAGGRVEEANSLFSQADQTKSGLTSLKSSERDPYKGFKNALKDAETSLSAIRDNSAKLPTNL